MDKAYDRIIWQNQPSTATALGATNLNKMDYAINVHDDRIIVLDTAKANQSTVNTVVQSITYNESTGVLTITKVNGTSTNIDTKLEKLAVNFVYNPETQQLDITLDDGTVQHVDMSALVTQYEFEDTDTVSFSVESDGTIKAGIIPGSITGEYLQPDYLADIIVQANIATTAAGNALAYRNLAESFAIGGKVSGDETNNAKFFRDQAKQYRDEAEGIVGVGIATDTVIGLVKGNGNVKVKSDGAMWANQYKDKATSTGTSVQFTDADDAQIAITAMGGTGSVTVVATNKNFASKLNSTSANGLVVSVAEDGTITINGTATALSIFMVPINLPQSGTYVLSANNPVIGNNVFIRLSSDSGGSNVIYNLEMNAVNKSGATSITGAKYIGVRIGAGITLSNFVIKPQLELGTTSTTYEPHIEKTLTIPDVTTATYPVYLTSYKGITNVFTLSTGQPAFTAVAKSELWANNYNLHNGDITASVDTITADTEIVKGKLSWLIGVIKYKLSTLASSIGTLSGLTTTIKSNLVSAINELKTTVDTKASQSALNSTNANITDLTSTVTANYTTLDSKINSQASGSPKGTYATLSALTAAYPTGNSNIYIVTADGNWYYWNGTVWTAGGVYQSMGIAHHSISEEKLSFVPVNGIESKNKFNKLTATTGYYVQYQDGALIANASYSASDFIPVYPSAAYRVSGSGGEQGAFYDINKNYISGLAFMGDLSTTPSNCYYVRLTIRNENLDITQIEQGTVTTPYEPYGNKIKASQIIGLTSISYTDIVVDINGSGQYTNLSAAIASISDSSYYHRYNIIIKSGIYDIFSNLTTTELGNYGIDVPDYVNLIGEGNPVLKGEIPSGTATLDNTTRISTINVTRNNELKNLTITAKNMRYAVHDDSGNSIRNWERKVENCTFIHNGNESGLWLYTNAWGEGCSSGSKSYFKNCKFISYTTNPAYSTHNNVSFSTASYHEFDNCQFLSLVNSGVSARFGSMGSGQIDRVVMKGCGFAGYISIIEELGNGVGIDFKFDGYSNQKNTYGFSYTSVNNYLKNLAFEDEVYTVLNLSGSSISPKDIVKITGINQVSAMESTDTAVRFYGVALESISNGAYGKVRVTGYIRLSDTNISSVSVGDKIGIVSGALAVVTSGDYIGICDVAGYIRLIGK